MDSSFIGNASCRKLFWLKSISPSTVFNDIFSFAITRDINRFGKCPNQYAVYRLVSVLHEPINSSKFVQKCGKIIFKRIMNVYNL